MSNIQKETYTYKSDQTPPKPYQSCFEDPFKITERKANKNQIHHYAPTRKVIENEISECSEKVERLKERFGGSPYENYEKERHIRKSRQSDNDQKVQKNDKDSKIKEMKEALNEYSGLLYNLKLVNNQLKQRINQENSEKINLRRMVKKKVFSFDKFATVIQNKVNEKIMLFEKKFEKLTNTIESLCKIKTKKINNEAAIQSITMANDRKYFEQIKTLTLENKRLKEINSQIKKNPNHCQDEENYYNISKKFFKI